MENILGQKQNRVFTMNVVSVIIFQSLEWKEVILEVKS